MLVSTSIYNRLCPATTLVTYQHIDGSNSRPGSMARAGISGCLTLRVRNGGFKIS